MHAHARTQLPGSVEYANYIFAEEYDLPSERFPHDTKASDGETPVLELLEMWSSSSSLLLSGRLRSGVVVLVKIL